MSQKAPSQIFVCRHGARLDASDSSWHLTSPTPYDPPLTFGGWTQARSLGNRIASHIVSQISTEYPRVSTPSIKPVEKAGTWSSSAAKNTTTGKDAKSGGSASAGPIISKPAASKLSNTKIVIHTSPFLRCVQTTIGVTAGMSQFFSDVSIQTDHEANAALPASPASSNKLVKHPRPIMRIEGFLGEWLCEDYFADIMPPPACDLMVGTAKIDLMRPSSAGGLKKHLSAHTASTHHHHHSHARAHSVGFIPPVPNSAIGKNEPIPRGHVSHAKDFCDVDYAYDSLRYGDGGEYGEEWGKMHKRVKVGFEKVLKGYKAGEVTACMKGQGLGSGNSSKATSFDQLAAMTSASHLNNANTTADGQLEVQGDTILVLISHGAICNALVGAMTHKPVLMDIGIASMSMGILIPPAMPNSLPANIQLSAPMFDLPKFGIPTSEDTEMEDPEPTSKQSSFSPYTAPAQLSLVENDAIPQYDVKVTASTDHLRSTNVKSPTLSPSLGGGPIGSVAPPRLRKSSVGGSGFSMYNSAAKLPAPLIGSAFSSNAPDGNTDKPSLFTGGRAMGMVYGSGSGVGGFSANKGQQMGFRRTASAAAATKGLWNRPGAEMERGSSDEGAVMTDEESAGSGEDKKPKKAIVQKKEEPVAAPPERKPSVSGAGASGMWGAGRGTTSAARGGLWNAGASAERRRRWTVANREDDGTEGR